jgi:hypothetical protein
MLSTPVIATTTCADFRCAQDRFVICTYRPRLLPGTTGWLAHGRQNAGAQTDLSCSVLGCAHVPLPLRRAVLPGCISKIFTRSLAFAQSKGARLRLSSAAKRRDL